MKKIALMIFFSLVLFSCEKDKRITGENAGVPLLSKVYFGHILYMEYTYNGANLPDEEKSKFHYTKHFYNHKNQLVASDFYWDISLASSDSRVLEAAMNRKEWVSPENTPKSISHSLEYNSQGQLTRKTYMRSSHEDSEYSEFIYTDGRISSQQIYHENKMSTYIDYLYDESGNLIKESKYFNTSTGGWELWTTTEYEYDNMHNPYQSFKRLMTPGKYTNPNNIIKETYTILFEVDASIEKVQVTKHRYEYNEMDYPVAVIDEADYIYK